MNTLEAQSAGGGVPADARLDDGPATGRPWALWRRQIYAIFRLEVRKNFLGRRAFLLYLMALLPIFAFSLFAVFPMEWRESPAIGWAENVYSNVFQTMILRGLIFFGCVWIFTNLFRGEVLDRSLHYYFLAPVRRQVLVAGKFLSGLVATAVLFGGSTLISYLLIYVPYGFGPALEHLFGGPGFGHLAGFLGVTALACLGYGAVFLIVGLIFRNPILPAAALLIWEGISFLLPAALKKLSVGHYLKSLTPLPMSEGPFAVVVEPTPPWLAAIGLLVFAALLMVLSGLKIRHMEIDYGSD